MENDLISVLIPAYNVQKYLGRCLRSVLKQTYQNLEIIVVDDGSVDNTYQIAKQYADSDSRIVLLQKVNEKNVAKTRNFLLDHCHGQYCVWVDSDDCIKANYVEKLYQALITNHADLSVCRFAIRAVRFPVFSPWRKTTRTYENDEMVPQLIYKAGLVLWNKMFRVDLINNDEPLRFDPKYCYGEDLLFNLEYLKRCQKMVCINAKLYCYSWRAGSEVHKKFSENNVNFINKLLELSETETNLVARDAIRGWAAFSCCGSVYLANKRRYPEIIARMRHFADIYRDYLYKNRLAKKLFKCILWIGLKTWCRPKKQTQIQKQ